ncbi:MAG: hypothetical protein IJP35_01015 [Clostridia bacterium]|nr:hypothetical protein [Clostridia bacterium]
MTALEIDRALSRVMTDQWNKSKQKLSDLPSDAKNERKAIQIEVGMYSLFMRFGQLCSVKAEEMKVEQRERVFYIEQRERVLYIREQMILREKQLSAFPKIKALYEAADADEKQRIIAAFQGEIQMRCQMYARYLKDWEAAKQNGDAEESFEAGVKVAVVEEGFRLWEQWRKTNGIYPDLIE